MSSKYPTSTRSTSCFCADHSGLSVSWTTPVLYATVPCTSSCRSSSVTWWWNTFPTPAWGSSSTLTATKSKLLSRICWRAYNICIAENSVIGISNWITYSMMRRQKEFGSSILESVRCLRKGEIRRKCSPTPAPFTIRLPKYSREEDMTSQSICGLWELSSISCLLANRHSMQIPSQIQLIL